MQKSKSQAPTAGRDSSDQHAGDSSAFQLPERAEQSCAAFISLSDGDFSEASTPAIERQAFATRSLQNQALQTAAFHSDASEKLAPAVFKTADLAPPFPAGVVDPRETAPGLSLPNRSTGVHAVWERGKLEADVLRAFLQRRFWPVIIAGCTAGSFIISFATSRLFSDEGPTDSVLKTAQSARSLQPEKLADHPAAADGDRAPAAQSGEAASDGPARVTPGDEPPALDDSEHGRARDRSTMTADGISTVDSLPRAETPPRTTHRQPTAGERDQSSAAAASTQAAPSKPGDASKLADHRASSDAKPAVERTRAVASAHPSATAADARAARPAPSAVAPTTSVVPAAPVSGGVRPGYRP